MGVQELAVAELQRPEAAPGGVHHAGAVRAWRSCTTAPPWPAGEGNDAKQPVNALWLAVGRAAGGLRQQARHARQRADAQDPGRPRSRRSRPTTASQGNEEQAIAAYRKFLAAGAERAAAPRGHAPPRRPGDGQRRHAQRQRRQPRKAAHRTTAPRSRSYHDYLKAYPNDPDNDRVLYQLARAHEQGGQLEAALATLDRLVARVPEDALPRRSAVPPRRDALQPARLRQGRAGLRDRAARRGGQPVPGPRAVHAGLGAVQAGPARRRPALVLRRARPQARLATRRRSGGPDDSLAHLSRADRELVEDTLRVTSISLANLQGAGQHPALHRLARAQRPTSSASTSSSASSTSSKTAARTPPTPSSPSPRRSRCMRRRRRCRRA